jgi:hypothetical protein
MSDAQRRKNVIKNRQAMLAKRDGGRSAADKQKTVESARRTANVLFFMLPAGKIVRVLKSAKNAIKGLRARGAKPISKPTATQISNAKPPTQAQIAAPKPTGGTTRLVSKPKSNVISGTAKEVKPVATTGGGSRAVKNPGTGVQQIRQANGKGKTMKTVRGTNRPSRRTQLSGATRLPSQGSKIKTGTAALQIGRDELSKLVKDRGIKEAKATPDTKKTMPPKKKSPSLPAKKPKRVDLGTVKARKVTPQKDTKKKETKKPQPTKVISAGKNTGFGEKGNQFAGGAEERRVLMKYYGGTGSKAARAAKEGKQGKLKELGMESLRKELRAAKVKRLKGK